MSEEGAMDCEETSQRLPFLLNGSLEPAERDAVRVHLRECEACRGDLKAARGVAEVFGAHLPTSVLVDLAFGAEPAGFDSALVRAHLDSCAACASDLALLRESRALEAEAPNRATALAARSRSWRPVGLAAALVTAFGAGVVSRAVRDEGRLGASESERSRLESRVGDLESEVRRLGGERERLAGEIDRLEAPRTNVAVAELLPAGRRQRSAAGGPRPDEVRLTSGTDLVVLLLGASSRGVAEAEIRDARGAVVWKGGGLVPGALGSYSVAVPLARFSEGDHSILLRSGSGAPEEFRLRLIRER